MSLLDYSYFKCRKCDLRSACHYPCEEYSNYKYKQHLADEKENIQKTIRDLRENENNLKGDVGMSEMEAMDDREQKFDDLNDFMENLIEYTVDQAEFLQVCNGLVHPKEVINWSTLLDYMKEKNKAFAEKHSLCQVCHSELISKNESRGEYFGTSCEEVILQCPFGCD